MSEHCHPFSVNPQKVLTCISIQSCIYRMKVVIDMYISYKIKSGELSFWVLLFMVMELHLENGFHMLSYFHLFLLFNELRNFQIVFFYHCLSLSLSLSLSLPRIIIIIIINSWFYLILKILNKLKLGSVKREIISSFYEIRNLLFSLKMHF